MRAPPGHGGPIGSGHPNAEAVLPPQVREAGGGLGWSRGRVRKGRFCRDV